jgi:hypothetical protein
VVDKERKNDQVTMSVCEERGGNRGDDFEESRGKGRDTEHGSE